MNKNQIEFLDYSDTLAPEFDRINRAWIETMFTVESVDDDILRHPRKRIIDTGGFIWFARHHQLGVVGTCALLKRDDSKYELTKMGVLESARGLKVGEALLRHVISEARNKGLGEVFLLTNKKCEAAIHLYEKCQFEHSEEIMTRYGKIYQRCDVAMRLVAD